MTLSGIGAGINELTALAATSELAPTAKRGKYVAVLVFTIIPFCPSVLWGQLIASHAGWRWCGLLCGVWAAIGFFLTLFFYFPPPRINSVGLSRRELVGRIDFVGGFLSIGGMIMFLAGMQWGGYQVSYPLMFEDNFLTKSSTNGPLPTYLYHFFSEFSCSLVSYFGRFTEPSIQCFLPD